MSLYYVIYNPISGGYSGREKAEKLKDFHLDKELCFADITKTDYPSLFEKVTADDGIIICGGDGTLNRFINDTDGMTLPAHILYYPCGSGNDFCRDVGMATGDKPFEISGYIKNLPTVTVAGKSYRFLNNVGFGIDGYCTLVGDEMREAGKQNINYAGIAIKGMLGGFHPVNAKITVDGVTESFKHVWLVPTMKGRYYGGGMMPTPDQDRNDPVGKVSAMVYHRWDKLKTLAVFPSIFNGEHIKHKDMIKVYTGWEITVEFDRPAPLQIDGETIPNVLSYTVKA